MQRFAQDRLLQVRLDLGLTQEQAAEVVGTDVRTWRRYESGAVNEGGFVVRTAKRRALLHRMSEVLGVDEAELLTQERAPVAPTAAAPARAWPLIRWHTLQRARHFVGREALLASLTGWALSPPDPTAPRVRALVAAGGTGKTALIDRVVTAASQGERHGAVFVWSFYEDERVERFLEAALEAVGGAPVRGMEAALEHLRAALAAGPPHLLVLDGLERLQSGGGEAFAMGELRPASVRRLLRGIAAGLGSSRALITSRLPPADLSAWEGAGLETINLPQLDPTDARALLERWGLRGDLAGVLDRVGCHALSVDMAGAYISGPLSGDAAGFGRVSLSAAAEDEPLARRLKGVLSAYSEALRPSERDLMARLCALPGGVLVATLADLADEGGPVAGGLAGLDRAGLSRLLDRLGRRGLVFASPEHRWSAHPFVRDFFRGRLAVAEATLFGALADSASRRLEARRSAQPAQVTLDAEEELLHYNLRAGRITAAFRVYQEEMGGFSRLGLARGEWSRGGRVLSVFFEGEPRPLARLMPAYRARVLYDRGLYAGALGNPAVAVRCYRAQLALGDQLPRETAQSWATTSWRTLAYTERLRGNTDAALVAIGRSLAVVEGGWSRVLGLAMRAAILQDLGQIEEAAADFIQAEREHGSAPVARWGLWKAEHLAATGRRSEARSLTQANLLECRLRGWPGHEAHCLLMLAWLALPDAPAAAREHLAAARRWIDDTGEVEMALRSRRVAAELALTEGDEPVALALIQSGLDDARACGFGRFERRLERLLASLGR